MNANISAWDALQEVHDGGVNIFSVLGQPEDPCSDWSAMRSAQMPGNDYIFLSAKINSKLIRNEGLTEFMLDMFQVMNTSTSRAKIYIYSDHNANMPEFAEFTVNWVDEKVKDFHVRPVKDVTQKDFIRTLFNHSGCLLGVA